MTKVHVLEKFNTTFGNIVNIQTDEIVRVGDKIIGDDGKEYVVKKIQAPTSPADFISVIV